MIIVKCSQSHYYDSEKFASCPHCAKLVGQGRIQDEPVTVALTGVQDDSVTVALTGVQDEPVTVALTGVQDDSVTVALNAAQDEPVTAALKMQKETVMSVLESQKIENYAEQYLRRNFTNSRMDIKKNNKIESNNDVHEKNNRTGYIVGWLVCIKGDEYGKDFRLYKGFNRIGRMFSNDIVLKDIQISAEEHCSIVYEEKKNLFYVFPTTARHTYVGGKLITQAQEIKSGEIITVGETELELVAFCTGEKRWLKDGQK